LSRFDAIIHSYDRDARETFPSARQARADAAKVRFLPTTAD
jgi:hypothetical protein